MKICHLTSVHPAEDIRIFVKECQSLQEAGHDVSLIVANSETYIKNNVHIIGVEAKSSNRFMKMFKGPAAVYKKALELNADVYHFHDPELMPVGLLLKNRGKKVIYDVHEDVPEQVLSKQWIPKPLRKIVSFTVKAAEKFASKRYDGIVTATPTINNRFRTYNSNSVVVHNYPIMGELLDDHDESPVQNYENLPPHLRDPYALYVGSITRIRGIFEMAEAIGLANQKVPMKLVLAGAFAPPALQSELEKREEWKYIRYSGFLDRPGVKQHLKNAKVGLVLLYPEPRYMVSLPIKMFEYMAAGIPVIAANFPLWKEIVDDAECGLCVDPLNPQEISNALQWIMEHPEEAAAMGQNGKRSIVEKYNWEHESKTLVQAYQQLSLTNDKGGS